MARIAAYYQENFHFSPVKYVSKKGNSFVVYEEPDPLPRDAAGPRLKSLTSSEPNLSPTRTYSPKTAVMTLKAKPHPFSPRIIEQSRLAIQRLEGIYEPPGSSNLYSISQLPQDDFDCQSHYGMSVYEEPCGLYKAKSKDKSRRKHQHKHGNGHYPEMYAPEAVEVYDPSFMQVRSFDTSSGESHPLEGHYPKHPEGFSPPVSFRSDSSHGRWQQWPWNMADLNTNPALLSPPSLDSGLSSQSITSSPSLEAEPVGMHNGLVQVVHPDSRHGCSCPHGFYAEPTYMQDMPYRTDDRNMPRTAAPPSNKTLVRTKRSSHLNSDAAYVENDFDQIYSPKNVRYGMLGIHGEPVQHTYIVPEMHNGNHYGSPVYHSLEKGDVYAKPSSSKPPKCSKPRVLITEPSEKTTSSESPVSSEVETVDKGQDPASISTSKSASATSSSNNLEGDEKRKSNRKTEKEIRELEDMYNKCNLGDSDLLERAERRDLPTVHQTKSDECRPGLTRSKSDTFYEMFSPTFKNPYEIPQRAPPRRRAGIPDIIADDMALRKHHKPVTTSQLVPSECTMTYMLCSSHFTPSVKTTNDFLLMEYPDVEYDDLSYRKHYSGKKSKILDPQPPFGIPLRPPPPQMVYNDYLHAIPNGALKPICHPRGNPDVVRDDMAYRTLRKDEPDGMYYDVAPVYRSKRR